MDYSQNMIDNVKALLEARKISSRQFAMSIGIAPSTFIDNLKSKKGFPIEVSIKVADALGFTVEELAKFSGVELLQREFSSPSVASLSEQEKLIVKTFRSFSDEGKEKVISYVEDLNRAGIYKNNSQSDVVSKEA